MILSLDASAFLVGFVFCVAHNTRGTSADASTGVAAKTLSRLATLPLIMGDPKSSSPTKTQGDDADKKPQQPVEDGVLLGLNEDGSTFVVPKLPDALETFIYPSQWNFSTLLTLLFSAATIFAGVSTESIYWAYTLSLFWRLMYNGFLGYILNVQSKSNGFTAAIERLERTPSTKAFLDKRLSKEIAASTLTVRSWAHFRLIATTVLDLDVVAFMCVVYRELADNFASDCDPDSLEHFCIPDFIAYPLGALLIVSSLYGKASAHRTLGHYAWFWGDFFFPVSGSLVFDGIFELFPHPMYTAGYAWMYGFALIVRSYALFALVIICHLLQMLFLSAVETPHIEKIYGKDEPATGKKERTSNFFAPKNFDFFRAGDLSSVLVALFFTGFCYLGVRWYPDIYTCGGTSQSYAPCVSPAAQASDESAPVSYFEMLGLGGESTCVLRGRTDYWCNTTDGKWGFCNCGHLSSTFFVVNALFWRFVQTGLSGLVLHNQAKSGFWMKHFAAKGVSQAEAFHNWIQVQNLLSTISYASFLAAAWYFFQWDEFTFFSAYGTLKPIHGKDGLFAMVHCLICLR